MKAALLTIGTEILFGQVVNTNAAYLSQELNKLGIDVMYHYTVGDNPQRMKDMIRLAFKDCDLILTTGGLGPTEDDLTKEMVCEVLGDELVLSQEMVEFLDEFEKTYGRKIPINNYKQAWVPSRGTIFMNNAGTAPGFALERDGKIAICLPGPPRELKYVFSNKVVPYLQSLSEDCIYYRQVRCFGIGESELETKLLPLIDVQTDPTIATYAKEGECAFRVASKRKTFDEAQKAVDEMCQKCAEYVGEWIYSYDDEEYYSLLARTLIEKNISISAAETITGGLFGKTLTDVPGISRVFDRSIVAYSNEAKIELLGVKKDTLSEYGAVSEQAAIEMAEGLSKLTKSDICVASTGIAGPDGGTDEKPVGLMYIAVTFNGSTHVRKVIAKHSIRQVVKNSAMLNMIDMVYKAVTKMV